MNRRQIETSREIRLWVTAIFGNLLVLGVTLVANSPEAMGAVKGFVKRKLARFKG